ncbi:hypothetical protein CALCODRAFT_485737 [Calocera cornea HHB12733]|uniref:GmrSD restriction endonucleases N-terminal domain-containing protein n=1 Tax=Calocera cornea HHB12733 TaxID=1353952 RepID=A0A165E6T7_9BASI|nr:hypothetical protein CALCODRAFT_485737 [Calocera cornea HHB12733]
MAQDKDDEYSLGSESDQSLSDATYSDLDETDYLDDIEASEGEEGEEKEAAPRPKPVPKPKPMVVASRKTNGVGPGASQAAFGGRDIVGKRLKPPNVVQVSTKMLFDEIESGEIDLDAEYQRDVVWPDKNQSKLIDSVFRNYYIPPVVFSRKDNGIKEVKICVDGKQRLTSIHKFMKGEIPFIERKTGKKYFWQQPLKKPKGWDLLPEAWKSEFLRASITTVSFISLSAAEERDIFQRVQLGMALTTPEKWQALQGPWPDFLREMRSIYFSKERPDTNILSKIHWDTSRAKDFQDIVRMAMMINNTILTGEAPITSSDKLEEALLDEEGPSDEFQMKMMLILGTFLRLVQEPRYHIGFVGKVAPVELVMIAVLIGKGMDVTGDMELAEGIRDMRRDVRSQVAKGYVMWKPEIVRKMMNFIERWRARLKKPEDRSSVASAQSRAALASANGIVKKRKKVLSEDSSEAEPLEERNVRPKASSAYAAVPGLARIPKKDNDHTRPVKPEPKGSSMQIGSSGVTPQRMALPPLVSRQDLLSQGGPRSTSSNASPWSSQPTFKTENRSPIERRPPVIISTARPAPSTSALPAAAPSAPAAPMDVATLQARIDDLSQEISSLQDLVARGDRPDHQELLVALRKKETLKSQLMRDKFMHATYRNGRTGPFGGR